MTPKMSEFSYGFALTNELIHHYSFTLTGAPQFPTQYAEGRAGGGYDVKLPLHGAPLFLQFKRSDYMKHRNAREAAHLDVPYYRMYLMQRDYSDQHELLHKLESGGNAVFYAAPRFHTTDELNNAYLDHQVAKQTSFIAPSWIGLLPDDKQHYVSIRPDDSERLFCSSRPQRIRTVSSEELLMRTLQGRARQRAVPLDASYMRDLGDSLANAYVEAKPQDRSRARLRAVDLRQQREPAEYAREVALMLYGCELLFVLSDKK